MLDSTRLTGERKSGFLALAWRAPELALDDERILVLDAEAPPEEWPAN